NCSMELNTRRRPELTWPRRFYIKQCSRRLPLDRHITVDCRRQLRILCSVLQTKFAEGEFSRQTASGRESTCPVARCDQTAPMRPSLFLSALISLGLVGCGGGGSGVTE